MVLKLNSLGIVLALAAGASSLIAQSSSASAPPTLTAPSGVRERLFFPEHWARGFADFDFAPPTNEPDLGRCAAAAGQIGGAAARCAAFARYMLSGYVEVRPFGRTVLRRVFLFASPRAFFGDNLPQVSYTASAAPIAIESSAGAAIELSPNIELRAVRHAVYWLGRYRGNLGSVDLGPNGPLGHYATVGLRWYFGGYAH